MGRLEWVPILLRETNTKVRECALNQVLKRVYTYYVTDVADYMPG